MTRPSPRKREPFDPATMARGNTITLGLSSSEASRRLAAEGANVLARDGRRSLGAIALEILQEPMLLLIAAGVIYLAHGSPQEAALIVCLATATVLISIVQQTRSERVIERLKVLAKPPAMVIRDGQRISIASEEVVRGDCLVMNEGDRVAADAVLIECNGLEADESLLAGESRPVLKSAPRKRTVRHENRVFAGSLILRGSGLGIVEATRRCLPPSASIQPS